MEEADLILKVAKFKAGWVFETEAGFISTSPATKRRQKVRILEVV
jgi:hypothetical protein